METSRQQVGCHAKYNSNYRTGIMFFTGEYACPVWNQSKHVKHVDTALNETCRFITGCLKATPVKYIYPLVGIALPEIRRYAATCVERTKQTID